MSDIEVLLWFGLVSFHLRRLEKLQSTIMGKGPKRIHNKFHSSLKFQGEYKLQGTLYDGNTKLGCYEVDATLKVA